MLTTAAAISLALLATHSSAQSGTTDVVRNAAREYRAKHEAQIVVDFARLLSLPNHASDHVNIRRNAVWIAEQLLARGVDARLLELPGAPPVVFGALDVAGAKHTLSFYAHYDGQPVDARDWTSDPFEPTLRTGPIGADSKVLNVHALPGRIDPEWRMFARSAADDKAAVIAMLAALDALRAAGVGPNANLKFFFEGEEEVGSPHLGSFLEAYEQELKTDLWIICDGPVHQNGQKLIFYGVRGSATVDITVYGPNRGLHSGHYGNWAPNPIVLLTHLIDSMRDTQAQILIPGFYDDVRPATQAELQAVRRMPDSDAELRRVLGLARTEGYPTSLQAQLLLPALNVRGIAGGRVGPAAANVISSEATASIDFRLVPDQTPGSVRARVEKHIAGQGFHIVAEPPDEKTRATYPRIARLIWDSEGGYPAARTALDDPMARRIADTVERIVGSPVAHAPTLGGSVPMYLFRGERKTPVIGVPIANFDNNQHAADENLRLQNLWDAIEIFVGLFVLPAR